MKSLRTSLLGAVALFAAPAVAAPQQTAPDYPPARRAATVDHYFGTDVPAPYQWMEEMQSPELHDWVKAENTLTNDYLAKIPVREWIRQRLTTLWNYPKEGTPQQVAGKPLFFRRNAGLQNQSVLYVKTTRDAAPRVLIDPNKLSPDGSIALADYRPSPDGALLAYALSSGGSDWQTIHLMDVATGKTLSDAVQWVKFSGISWTRDGQGFFYSRYPEPAAGNAINQQVVDQKLYYHKLGTPQSADRMIYSRPDLPSWIIGGSVSEDGRYLFVYLQNGTAPQNELYYADLGDPQHPDVAAKLTPLFTRNDATYSVIGVEQGTLYLQTTHDAPRGRIVAAPLDQASAEHWRTIVPEGEGVIASSSLAGGKLLVDNETNATSRLDLYTLGGKKLNTLDLPTIGSVGGISARNDSGEVYYSFTSFLYPTSVYRYDLATGTAGTVFKPDVKFDPDEYESKQVFYRSKDGTMVPMFIVAKKGVTLDGSNPTVLYGYGGFNITITPSFNPMLPVWLELGGVYAVPNLRGGGVHGEAWHEAGMMGNKQNVFDDFAAAATYLIDHGYTSPKHLGIQGYSNGGLLTGASITEHPELFGAAYIGHGVLDMLRYQKFSGGALWAPEYGTSADPEAFKWLHTNSPLHNVTPGTCYPPTLITTSWDDDRVVPMHEFKFAAAAQHAQGCANPVLLYTTGATSHVYMPTDQEIDQTADVWAFQAYSLGITGAGPTD
ncbi:MAG: prolyl oligopeptidase family serine peptidase [Sphingomonas sp.]